MTFTSFSNANDIVDRFLGLLNRYGIDPSVGSSIESELLTVYELLEHTKNDMLDSEKVGLLATAGGVYDLATKLLAIETQPEFVTFVPHLCLFSSKLPLASVSQTTGGEDTDDVHRKLTELYLASLAVHIGTNVVLDHPTASSGNNPDVLFDLRRQDDNSVKRYALAIKTISSMSGQTIFERILEGSRQINASACLADRGMVVINTQGSIDHLALWSTSFTSLKDACEALKTQILNLAEKTSNGRAHSDWNNIFYGKTAPVVLYLGQAVVKVNTQIHHQTPTILKLLICDRPTQQVDAEAIGLAEVLNKYMQMITKGIPGEHGKCPA